MSSSSSTSSTNPPALPTLPERIDVSKKGVTFVGPNGAEVYIGPVPQDQINEGHPIPTYSYGPGYEKVIPFGICVRRPDNDPHKATQAKEMWWVPFFSGFGFAIVDFARKISGQVEYWCQTISHRKGRYENDSGSRNWFGDDEDGGGIFVTARRVGKRMYGLISCSTWRDGNAHDHGHLINHIAGQAEGTESKGTDSEFKWYIGPWEAYRDNKPPLEPPPDCKQVMALGLKGLRIDVPLSIGGGPAFKLLGVEADTNAIVEIDGRRYRMPLTPA